MCCLPYAIIQARIIMIPYSIIEGIYVYDHGRPDQDLVKCSYFKCGTFVYNSSSMPVITLW